ncbi:hypothetical protein BDV95DRAFT_628656 [Massariosphaeria phaeospora]|uniref:Uncharacterized protein n=1 Tax=Massariosphaeria phaeospora TaxID=100035 RepID=A0A7C8M9Z6_9PLEO|nr:hypothetical protein BDV95DRAFT_628656 [Massariosphaeria phaeospora]
MSGPTYTVEQLHYLKESPLVKKPDGLPSILQWMDVPPDQNISNNTNINPPTRRPRREEAPAAGEPRVDRPGLLTQMGHFGRRASMQPEDTVLGPPKLAFTSASRATTKGTEQAKERTAITSADGDHLGDRFPRERWTRDREGDRAREKPGFANGRRPAREDGEGWMDVKGRKSLGQEDFDRGFGRNGDRDKAQKDEDAGAPTRRIARDKFDRWGRRDDTPAKEGEGTKFAGAGQGGWRDRERDRDRDWSRGTKVEEDPEWMDAAPGKKENKPRTQEDFQRWKEQMKANQTPAEEKEEPKLDLPVEDPVRAATSVHPPLATPMTPSALEPSQGILFGNWGREKVTDTNASDTVTAKPKPDKKSRFMDMFAKPEEPAPPSLPAPVPASPGPAVDADKEGFQRILQMLGGASIATPQVAQPSVAAPTNGSRHGGILDFVQQSPREEPQERLPPRQHGSRTLEHQAILENILTPRPAGPESRPPQQARYNTISPDNAFLEQYGPPRLDSNRHADEFSMQQPPSRNTNAQEANLAAVLNNRAREEANAQAKSRERSFLLDLMKQTSSRVTPPQLLNHNIPRPPPENQNLAFYDQPQRQQVQPKGRGGLPSLFMEESRMFAENEMMLRREAERREQQLRDASFRELNLQQQQQEAMRNRNRMQQMGINHDDPALAGLQRRTTAGEIPRQMTNMGIPSQSIPEMPYMGPGRQPGMPPTSQERSNIAPPPGFGGPAMRQPPGLVGGPGPQQRMGPDPNMSFSAGNTPLGHPPGFAPSGNMRGNMFPVPGGVGIGGNGMQGPPQGYFPPPGYGPPMGAPRGGEDLRMMYEQQLGVPNPRQQPGRPGPPPNMY